MVSFPCQTCALELFACVYNGLRDETSSSFSYYLRANRGKLTIPGKSSNLAPFSYFNLINHDPPLFIFGFAGGFDRPKDSLSNLVDSKDCVINIISEHYVEAANACSINAPYEISEWNISGLTSAPSQIVKPSRVKEAIFSVEAKLVETKEFESRATPGKKTGVLAIVEGVRFWVREDAINEAKDYIDPAVRFTLLFSSCDFLVARLTMQNRF